MGAHQAIVARLPHRRLEGQPVEVLGHDEGDGGLEHRHLDRLADAGSLAVEEGGDDRVDDGQGGRLVGNHGGQIAGLAVDLLVQDRHPGRRLDRVVVGGLVAVRPVGPVAVGGAVDDPGVDRFDLVVVEAQAPHRRGPEVVHQGIRALRHLQQRRPARLLLEVEYHAPLVAVTGQIEGAHPGVTGGAELPVAVPGRRLDLDHVGAQVAQDLAGPGPQHDAGQLQDPYPCERSRHA